MSWHIAKNKKNLIQRNWLAWKTTVKSTPWLYRLTLMIFLFLNSTQMISLESFLHIWQPSKEPYQTLCHFTSGQCISLCVHRLWCIKTGKVSLYGRHTSCSEYHVFKRRFAFFVLIKGVATDSGSVSWSERAGSRTASRLSCPVCVRDKWYTSHKGYLKSSQRAVATFVTAGRWRKSDPKSVWLGRQSNMKGLPVQREYSRPERLLLID